MLYNTSSEIKYTVANALPIGIPSLMNRASNYTWEEQTFVGCSKVVAQNFSPKYNNTLVVVG